MLPELDVEVGIVDRLSLEMVTGYRKIVSTATLTTKNNRSIKLNQTTSGLNSIMLGANIGILSEKGYRPAMYLQNQFYLPKTGQTTFQNEEPGYFAILIGNQLQTKNFAKSSFGAIKFTFDFNAFAK